MTNTPNLPGKYKDYGLTAEFARKRMRHDPNHGRPKATAIRRFETGKKPIDANLAEKVRALS